jgi:ABC-type branched-subunit amino acid transport system permease subunit
MQKFMTDDTAQGIYWELHYVLKNNWTITREVDGFRLGPPAPDFAETIGEAAFFSEVWRISSFVAYQYFSSLTKTETGYKLESLRNDRTGYFIIFDASPNGLINHRPTPPTD